MKQQASVRRTEAFTFLDVRIHLAGWDFLNELIPTNLALSLDSPLRNADKAAIKAMLVNRVGDFGTSVENESPKENHPPRLCFSSRAFLPAGKHSENY
ncbi:hypothetical protein AgCh_000047 [Apium graveolens]